MESVREFFRMVSLFYCIIGAIGVGVCIEWIVIYVKEEEREDAVRTGFFMLFCMAVAIFGFVYSR